MKLNPHSLKLHDGNYRQMRDFVSQSLVEDIANNGQLKPIKVIKSNDAYYVVDGWRRVLAMRQLNTDIEVEIVDKGIINIMGFLADSNKRSDYEQYKILSYISKATGMNYRDLSDSLNISYQRITNLFAFKDLNVELVNTIKDFRLVTCSTAKEMKTFQKSESGLKALIELAEQIRNGIGSTSLRREVKKHLSKERVSTVKEEAIYIANRKLGTFRGNRQFVFDEQILAAISKDNLIAAIKHGVEEMMTIKV